jgi:hypothetical protein
VRKDEVFAALDLSQSVLAEMLASVPEDDFAAEWFTRYALGRASDPTEAVKIMARLYIAADNHAAQLHFALGAARGAAQDLHKIVADGRTALAGLAYDSKGTPEQEVVATALLNATGLSKYHEVGHA